MPAHVMIIRVTILGGTFDWDYPVTVRYMDGFCIVNTRGFEIHYIKATLQRNDSDLGNLDA
jgi:hypothetical protein